MLRPLGALVAAAFVAPTAVAAPARDLLVRPGQSIADVRLGMTARQVKAVVGPHDIGRAQRVGRTRSLALTWWRGFAYSFTVRRVGSGDDLRVALVATDVPSERTASGIGPGASFERLRSAFPRLRCRFVRTGPAGQSRKEYYLEHRMQRDTVFNVLWDYSASSYRVAGIEVRLRSQRPPVNRWASC